jgi:hypothetical protein
VVFLDCNQKLHLRPLTAAPAANLQQKLAERLCRALAPAIDAAGPAGKRLRLATDGCNSMQYEKGNFAAAIKAKR